MLNLVESVISGSPVHKAVNRSMLQISAALVQMLMFMITITYLSWEGMDFMVTYDETWRVVCDSPKYRL